jgi:hypothetical protein
MASGLGNLMQIKKMLSARRNYRNFPLESRKLPPRSSTIVRQMQSLTGHMIAGPAWMLEDCSFRSSLSAEEVADHFYRRVRLLFHNPMPRIGNNPALNIGADVTHDFLLAALRTISQRPAPKSALSAWLQVHQ